MPFFFADHPPYPIFLSYFLWLSHIFLVRQERQGGSRVYCSCVRIGRRKTVFNSITRRRLSLFFSC